MKNLETTAKIKVEFIIAIFILLVTAFIQCYKVTHDLHWPFDGDLYRDMSFAQGILDGNFGKDSSYAGEWLWYNPLLTMIEAAITRISGLPLHIVIARGGAYLNLLGPITFIMMAWVLFDYKIVLASLLSYLFLASGNLEGETSATYSPWLFPGGFSQFFFYLNIVLTFKAFTRQTYFWFMVLGASIGLSFLSHASPAILIVLIIASIQAGNILTAFKEKNYRDLKKYIYQGISAAIPFLLAASPMLFYIIGKYHMHLINRDLAESREGIFAWFNSFKLLKENISFPFIISVIGFIWFYKNFRESLIRKIILNWFFISIIMYFYTMALPKIHEKLHLNLPDTVSAFHYFYYLKALQSVFFGFGFVFLLKPLIYWLYDFLNTRIKIKNVETFTNSVFILFVFLYAIIYFPNYKNRHDLVHPREVAQRIQTDKDRIEVYDYIVQNILPDKVILCEDESGIFPIMATGRKMVVASIIFSNPYVDFGERYTAKTNMLLFLKTGEPLASKRLFDDYHVNFALLLNKEIKDYKTGSLPGPVILKNDTYSLFTFGKD